MGLEQLEAFKAGLRKTETGDWLGASAQRGNWRNGDGPVGSYGVRASNFAYWAAEVGLGGADWQDPDVMERVVTMKLSEYYREYGDWDLVSLAWIGGTALADAAQANPNVRSANKVEGKTVGEISDEVIANMRSAPVEVTGVPPAPEEMPFVPGQTRQRKPSTAETDAKTQLLTLFSGWGDDLAGGQRSDYREIGVREAAEQVEEQEEEQVEGVTDGTE